MSIRLRRVFQQPARARPRRSGLIASPLEAIKSLSGVWLPSGIVARPVQLVEATTTDYDVTAEAGVDADIRLARRWSAVPQLRAIAFEGGVSLRPGIALRVGW